MEKVLITGITGGLGRLLARRLLGDFEVCGVDTAPWAGRPREVAVHQVDLRKRKLEDVFRTELPTAVVHMGFVRELRGDGLRRHDTNVRGTKQLLDHCANHGVQRLILLSSGTVYGAFPENPIEIDEDQALSASRSYPEIRDRVEVDTLATAFMWKNPHIRTCVLRPVSILGEHVHAMMNNYLRLERIPTVLGFDPMMQFVHEADVIEAIALSLGQGLQGVFNVTGPGEVPLSTAISETRGNGYALPEFVLRPLMRRLFHAGFVPWPEGAIDYLKYPVTLSGERFVEATNFRPLFGLEETFQAVHH